MEEMNSLKKQIKAEIMAELESWQDAGYGYPPLDKNNKKQDQTCKQINYNVLTQKQFQGQSADADTKTDEDDVTVLGNKAKADSDVKNNMDSDSKAKAKNEANAEIEKEKRGKHF